MSKKSTHKVIEKSATQIAMASAADLDRLRAAMQGPVDTSDLPERQTFQRLRRDSTGKLPPRRSIIRAAVVRQMQRRHLTAYRLWRLARVYCPTLSQSAVGEFLKGLRQLELPSVEALLSAAQLQIVVKRRKSKRQRYRVSAS
jgi:hypothetical protein